MDFEAAVARAATDFDALGTRYALIGGVAVSLRSEPRFTQDIDWAVAVSDDRQAEEVAHGLVRRGYRIETTIENAAHDRMATLRMVFPGDRLLVDVLFASSGIEPEIAAAAETVEAFRGVRIPVARTGHLIALKLLSYDDEARVQDKADLRGLMLVATDDEIELATTAVGLIEARGYARGRDLRADLAVWIAKLH